MCVDVNCAFHMHEVTKRKDKEGNVGAFAPFVDMKSSNVMVIVDVVRNEKGCLENSKDVIVRRGCGLSVWVDALLYLIKQNLCGIRIMGALYLLRKNLFASGREFGMKLDVPMNYTGGGRGGKRWGKSCGKE